MSARYICCRCDTRAESSVGHHLCEAPSDEALFLAFKSIAPAVGLAIMERDTGFVIGRLGDLAHARGYRWTLSSVGDGTEYRATFARHLGNPAPSAIDRTPARAFARHLGNPAPSAIDRTPARAFARAWLRTIEAAQRAAEVAA